MNRELFDYPQALVSSSMAQSFLKVWHTRLGRPSLNRPAWQAFEHGTHTLFNTILSGLGTHQAVANALQLPLPVKTHPRGTQPRWMKRG